MKNTLPWIHYTFGLMIGATLTACPGGGATDESTSDPDTDGSTSGPDAPTSTESPTDTTDATDTTDTTDPGNAPPTAPGVAITPADPDGTQMLECAVTSESTDPDGDAVTYAYRWLVNGDDALLDAPLVPASDLMVGQEWTCVVTPSDGQADGPTGEATVTIAAPCAGLDFDGGDDVITAAHVAADVWTIEAWVFPRSDQGQQAIVSQLDPVGVFEGFELGIEGARPYVFAPDGAQFSKVFAPEPLPLNAWHHLAGIYDGTDLRLAVDGVIDPVIVTTAFVDSDVELQIGSRLNNDFFFDGEIAGVRVSSSARYAVNFTPDTAWTADADTLALYSLDEGSGAVAGDGAAGDNDGAIAGDAAWTSSCPTGGEARCAALDFDGGDDVVTAAHLAASEWTIEAWVFPGEETGQQAILSQLDNAGVFAGFELGVEGGRPYVFAPDGEDFDGKVFPAEPLVAGQWHHIAGIYDGAHLRLAVDGVLDPAVVATGFVDSDLALQIGSRLSDSFFFDGTIARVRVSSVARYVANFAPSVHLAPDADTLGLWRLAEGQGLVAADSSSAVNDGDIAGDAVWTTSCPASRLKPCISLDFDGEDAVVTADHLTATEWTLEAWVLPRSNQGQQAIVSQLDPVGVFEGFELGIEGAVPYVFAPNGMAFNPVKGAGPLALDEWHHVAGIYDGVNVRLAVDGVFVPAMVATAFVDSDIELQIGSRLNNDFYFDGAISGVRVSSVARWTDDFSPPLALVADADTLGLYRLEEGKGMVAVDGSGAGNDGALAGNATWAASCPP
jgi:hypothetical protein